MTRPLLLLLAVFTAATCLADQASDRQALTQGVNKVTAPGALPGTLAIDGNAFALLTGTSGNRTDIDFAAVRIGAGRAVVGGHAAYLIGTNLPRADNARFLQNIIQWLGNKPIDQCRVGLVGYGGMKAYLHSLHADAITLRPEDLVAPIVGIDVLCIDQGSLDSNPSAQAAVMQFVKSGHGYFTAGPGWGWQQLHPTKNLFTDLSANQMLTPYGIVLTNGTIDSDATTADADSPLLNPKSALAALEKGGLNAHDTSLATTAVDAGITIDTPGRAEIVKRLEALVDSKGAELIPTESHHVDSSGLARLAARLFQIQNEDLPPEKVKPYPGAADFPGSIPAGAPRISKTFEADLRTPAWHGSGLYAAPGEVVQVTIPASAVALGLRVQVGSHTDGLWDDDNWARFPEITMSVPLTKETTKFASPFGGMIFLDVPEGLKTGSVDVRVSHAVEAPRFVRGKTTPAEWKRLRMAPAPWAELVGNRVALSVPSSVIRDLDDPEALMAYWDSVLDNVFALYAAPPRLRGERYCTDRQISVGYMHNGYPIMTFEDVAKTFVTLSDLTSDKGKTWGFYHEMGHNFQRGEWTFEGTGEVTNNLFSLYGNEKLNGVTPATYGKAHGAMAPDVVRDRLKKYLAAGAKYDQWQGDPFLALSMYAQLREAFGWEAFTKVFAGYWASSPSELPKTDLEKRDQWMVRFSRAIGKNLGPFFHAWGVPTSAAARQSIANLPSWMPPDWPGA